MEYPMSENISDYYDDVMGERYVDSVDIDEIMQIAEVASVGSGDVKNNCQATIFYDQPELLK
jgi:hypothetical protein